MAYGFEGPLGHYLAVHTRISLASPSESTHVCLPSTPLPLTPLCGVPRSCTVLVVSIDVVAEHSRGSYHVTTHQPLPAHDTDAARTKKAERMDKAPRYWHPTASCLGRCDLLIGVVLDSEHNYLTQITMFSFASFCRFHVHDSSTYMASDRYLGRK